MADSFTIPFGRAFVTIAEACMLMGCCPNTIRNWIKDGRIPAYGTHHRRLVQISDLLNPRPTSSLYTAKRVRDCAVVRPLSPSSHPSLRRNALIRQS